MAWLGLREMAWGGDYEREAFPAFEAIAHGHLTSFLQRVPAYGGSLIERAPFALIPNLWGGGEEAVYTMVGVPCLLAGAALGVWLVRHMGRDSASTAAKLAALCLCVANPITLRAIELGHPEELLGAVLCVWAVLLARRGHALGAGIVLGLAVANKEWALLAVGPALVALPGRRVLLLSSAAAAAALVLAPLILVHGGDFASGASATAAPSSAIFQPMQVFWFLGHHSANAGHLLGAIKRDFRLAPGWIGKVSHPLVILAALPLTALAWRATRRGPSATSVETGTRNAGDALLLLALLLLLRCMLDTWDNVYYPLPFIIATLVWETCSLRRAPLLALGATGLVWINAWLSLHASADLQAAFFLAWSLPLAGGLALKLYVPGRLSPLPRPTRSAGPSGAFGLARAAR
jgi:hypothetical protein